MWDVVICVCFVMRNVSSVRVVVACLFRNADVGGVKYAASCNE